VLIYKGVRIFQNFRFLPLGACAYCTIIRADERFRRKELMHLAFRGCTAGSRVRGPSTRLGLAQDFRFAPACAFGRVFGGFGCFLAGAG